MLADRLAHGDILVGHPRGLGIGRRAPLPRSQLGQPPPHPLHRPAQVDRRGTGGADAFTGVIERSVGGVLVHRQGHAIGRRRADQRRAAHHHVPDGGCGLIGRAQRDHLEPVGQQGLVDDVHPAPVGVQPDGAAFAAVGPHATQLTMTEIAGYIPCMTRSATALPSEPNSSTAAARACRPKPGPRLVGSCT